MTEKEIIKYIDAGANFYVSMFGRAEHMDCLLYTSPEEKWESTVPPPFSPRTAGKYNAGCL